MPKRICQCLIPDWYELRRVLGVSQEMMAEMMQVNERTYRRIEGAGHHCVPPASQYLLLIQLAGPHWQPVLRKARYELPAGPWDEAWRQIAAAVDSTLLRPPAGLEPQRA